MIALRVSPVFVKTVICAPLKKTFYSGLFRFFHALFTYAASICSTNRTNNPNRQLEPSYKSVQVHWTQWRRNAHTVLALNLSETLRCVNVSVRWCTLLDLHCPDRHQHLCLLWRILNRWWLSQRDRPLWHLRSCRGHSAILHLNRVSRKVEHASMCVYKRKIHDICRSCKNFRVDSSAFTHRLFPQHS